MSQHPKFEEFDVKYLDDNRVAVVAFNRPRSSTHLLSKILTNFELLLSFSEGLVPKLGQ